MVPLKQRNLGLDLVRVTEAAALAAGRWMGRGEVGRADVEGALAMRDLLNTLPMDGQIVHGEEGRLRRQGPLDAGTRVGTGDGPVVDLVVDPVDGDRLVAKGWAGALSVAVSAPRGTLWAPTAAAYMEKLVVNRLAADALVEQCLDAPAAWTLALVARVIDKPLRDVVVVLLDRARHRDLIAEIREAGARVMLLPDGDIAGAIMAASREGPADVMMGIGGVTEGIVAAAAVKVYGGAMLGRLAPQSDEEKAAVKEAGLDTKAVLTANDLVRADEAFFAATGVTDGPILGGVRFHSGRAVTESLLLRGETGTRRTIQTEHFPLANAPEETPEAEG